MFSCRILRGVSEKRPALPKYAETWDGNVVLDYLTSLPDTGKLDLKQLTLRTVMLLALLTGQRGHALYHSPSIAFRRLPPNS